MPDLRLGPKAAATVLVIAVVLGACGTRAEKPKVGPLDALVDAGLTVVTEPEDQPTNDPFVLTKVQVTRLATFNSRSSGVTGAQLDALADLSGGRRTSSVLRAWIAEDDSPAAVQAREWMGDVPPEKDAAEARYPWTVVGLFAYSDATPVEESESPSAASRFASLDLALAAAGRAGPRAGCDRLAHQLKLLRKAVQQWGPAWADHKPDLADRVLTEARIVLSTVISIFTAAHRAPVVVYVNPDKQYRLTLPDEERLEGEFIVESIVPSPGADERSAGDANYLDTCGLSAEALSTDGNPPTWKLDDLLGFIEVGAVSKPFIADGKMSATARFQTAIEHNDGKKRLARIGVTATIPRAKFGTEARAFAQGFAAFLADVAKNTPPNVEDELGLALAELQVEVLKKVNALISNAVSDEVAEDNLFALTGHTTIDVSFRDSEKRVGGDSFCRDLNIDANRASQVVGQKLLFVKSDFPAERCMLWTARRASEADKTKPGWTEKGVGAGYGSEVRLWKNAKPSPYYAGGYIMDPHTDFNGEAVRADLAEEAEATQELLIVPWEDGYLWAAVSDPERRLDKKTEQKMVTQLLRLALGS